ncbi:hypothetical protein RDI58_024314 [Solanum bulbocastanum]|uniref:Uncharacterized protein n=1 Tax=Solanum bulbocastanum TaxID=147425 RepID=A0AAN8Y3H3_SOLBU
MTMAYQVEFITTATTTILLFFYLLSAVTITAYRRCLLLSTMGTHITVPFSSTM